MADFADFQQVDEGEGLQIGGGDDVFGGMQMTNQENGDFGMDGMNMGFQPAAPVASDDYTPEEREQIQRVEEEEDERKRSLFERQQDEQRLKNERKTTGQSALADWKT